MKMARVAILDDYQNVALSCADWTKLPEGSQVEVFNDHLFDETAIAKRLFDFDTIVAMRERTPFPRSLLDRLPNLKLLITTGARNASFDMAAAKERGIVLCGTRGVGSSTAELTWGLILSLVRHIPREDQSVRTGGWQTTLGPNLAGKTLGVIGLGNLGSQVAKAGVAFGMDVIAWSTNLTQERAEQAGARLVAKDELLSTADVITIHLVLGDRSRGLIGANELAQMKPSAYLVNTSRGPIVDEKALIDALSNKRIAGAALDVFDVEPLPADHPFRRLENTVITPHIGYVTTEGYKVFYEDAVEDILAFLAGNPVRTF
jgi:phosphoglycerate dehydrogenase-like enzyme